MRDKVLITPWSAFLCLTREAMPLYGLGYPVRVYQFALDVAPKCFTNASGGRNGEGLGVAGGWGGVVGTAVPAAVVQNPRKSINLSERSL